MIFKRKPQTVTSRFQITPDPQQAAELERRLAEISYQPRQGFLRDPQQMRRVDARAPSVARFVGWNNPGS